MIFVGGSLIPKLELVVPCIWVGERLSLIFEDLEMLFVNGESISTSNLKGGCTKHGGTYLFKATTEN
jgi:hypothetical protein